MRKQKPETFPRGEFGDQLDQLLSAASRAGLGELEIANALIGRAQRYRERHAMLEPVEAARVVKTTVVGGDGNLAQRLGALLRGES
jgi:hypothetical protein